jgi:hypothetical protein
MEHLIIEAMAKAFFASAWADLQEDKDIDDETRVNLSGREIMDVMPDEIDPAAFHAAKTLAMDLQRMNRMSVMDLFHDAAVITNGDRDLTLENFGHYLAMQAMGHGVGLADAFGDEVCQAIKVPYIEFGSYSLEREY